MTMDAERYRDLTKEVQKSSEVEHWRERALLAEQKLRQLELKAAMNQPRRSRRKRLYALLTGAEA